MKITPPPDNLLPPAFLSLSLMLPLLNGCPGDDGNGGGDDEIGGIGETGEGPDLDSIDPLDGGGVPSGPNPDPTQVWRSPTTLGNGLVHDSRLDRDEAPFHRNYPNSDLADGVPWSDFVVGYQARTAIGFRPAQLRARVQTTPTGNNSTTLEITDDSVYVADDDANYKTEIETYVFGNVPSERNFANYAPSAQGARPVSIDTFATPGSSKVGYSVAWVYDESSIPWMILAGQSAPTMLAKLDELAAEGFRPISIASRRRVQSEEYAAIFVQDGMESFEFDATLSKPIDVVTAAISSQWELGFYPIRISSEHGWPERLDVIWVRRPPGMSMQVRLNLTGESFASEDADWRMRGYHLESVADYSNAGEPRVAAVWVRYEPYLRWQGTDFPPNDVAYQTRYSMFHDQAIRTVSFATEVDCSGGQPCPHDTSCYTCPDDDTVCLHDHICVESQFRTALRPSATLHIFEGEALVLSRAYTFAPAIYKNTFESMPMKVAGVSKSITAAAVLRELALHQLPPDSPFVTVAKIEQAPAVLGSVTVLDVLRHLGGFKRAPISYADHTLIDDSIYGSIPIDGTEMFNYAVAGHLGVGGNADDDYWDAQLYEKGQLAGAMSDSDPGYAMLGQLPQILSGAAYADYVTEHMLTPLGLNQTCFPDVGHRIHAHGATLAGLGSYLVNDAHPYHIKPAQQAEGQGDCPGMFGWKWNGDECSLVQGCGCLGADCDDLYVDWLKCGEDHVNPQFGLAPLVQPAAGDGSVVWTENVGPIDPAAPERASQTRYSGSVYQGGAPLAASGWHANGASLGALIRAISQTETVMPHGVASELWNPTWWNKNSSPFSNWSHGLGWYVRGNWVAWVGDADGAMAVVLHNRHHDFTVVYLSNAKGDPLAEFMDPLMQSVQQVWNTSPVGAAFPCTDDLQTPASECSALLPPVTTPY